MLKITMIASLALLAGSASAQSIDSVEEAWTIAKRNGVTPQQWDLVHVKQTEAAFLLNRSTGASSRFWVAYVDTADLSTVLMLVDFQCRDRTYQIAESSTRTWLGNETSSSGRNAVQSAPPGSIIERVLDTACAYPINIPGPPRATSGG